MREFAPIFGGFGRNLNFSGVASCKNGGLTASAVCGRFSGRFSAVNFAYKSHFAQRSRRLPGGGYARGGAGRVTPSNTFERFLGVSVAQYAQKAQKVAQKGKKPIAEVENPTGYRERYNIRAKGKFPKTEQRGEMGNGGERLRQNRSEGGY